MSIDNPTPGSASRLTAAATLLTLCSAGALADPSTPAQPGPPSDPPLAVSEGAANGESEAAKDLALPEGYKTSTWIGKPVRDPRGEQVGEIRELVMDDWGVLRYVLIRSDRFPGAEGRLIAVPLGDFRFPLTGRDHLALRSLPGQAQDAQSSGSSEGSPARPGKDPSQGLAQAGQGAGGGSEAEGQSAANRDLISLPQEQERLFRRLDADGDGSIDKREAQANERFLRSFDRIDSYADQTIDRSEFSAFEAGGEAGGGSD